MQALMQKTLTIASNRNFESCLSCSSVHFPVFPFLPRVFPLPLAAFAHYCDVLLNAPLSDQDSKKRVRNEVIFAGNLDPSSLTAGGPVFPLVCSFRRPENFLAWRELFANLCELKSCILFWDKTTLSESIGYIDLSDFRQISPKHFRNSDKPKFVGKF